MAEPVVSDITLTTATGIHQIARDDWHRFAGDQNPFVRYEFFQALEESGCTTEATGWAPRHLMFYRGGQLCGVAPAYLKTHSMGEYVFDWSWADAYQRYRLPYYPKLLMAIPFTPSQGPRLLLDEQLRSELSGAQLAEQLTGLTRALGAHSWHLLFPDSRDQAMLRHSQRLQRTGCQFHWHNRGYGSFDEFLAALTSRKRKSIRKERRQVAEQKIHFRRFHGRDIPDQVLSAFYVFYQATYLKRGQAPYLNQAFFQRLREYLPGHLHIIVALRDDEMIAAALFLSGEQTLYGRYWGCLDEYSHLHFETCYYQGIELALTLGLKRFDAGAQGEHKLVRGFEPVATHSWHDILHPGFREAIADFCEDERRHAQAYAEQSKSLLPYRREEPDAGPAQKQAIKTARM
ncbi:MAG TPA: GNAT family N-acetyltransferase [Marinobacter sp.]|nr:GNAT family N-acetyltransferase [Marinobacter sp.]